MLKVNKARGKKNKAWKGSSYFCLISPRHNIAGILGRGKKTKGNNIVDQSCINDVCFLFMKSWNNYITQNWVNLYPNNNL